MAERLTLVCDKRGRGGHRDYGERDRQARKAARKTFKRTTIAPKP